MRRQGILDPGVIRPRTANEPSNEDLPSWSRDGPWLYFQSRDSRSSIPIDLVAPSVIKNQQIEKGVSRYPGARYSNGPLHLSALDQSFSQTALGSNEWVAVRSDSKGEVLVRSSSRYSYMFLSVLLLIGASAMAQDFRATLNGRVSDSSGGAIPGVTV